MSKVLIGITGSIAAYKTCELISLLKKSGHEVRVVTTNSALQFVGKASLEGLSGEHVYTDTFEDGNMMSHISLARWADIFVTAPCSLAQMSRFANGLADNLLTNIYYALKPEVPKYIAPAMNTQMWLNAKNIDLIEKLKAPNLNILLPSSGTLACGELGEGRMQEPKDIFNSIFCNKNKKRVLITSGGTKEYIDSIRYIGNHSTGKTGARLADDFAAKGYCVDLLKAKDAAASTAGSVNTYEYINFSDIKQQLQKLLSENTYDLIIHAAAVSDFSVKNKAHGKIDSDKAISIELSPNEKLIDSLRALAKGQPKIVGFKLTSQLDKDAEQAAAKKVLKTADFVVHNRMEDIEKHRHLFALYNHDGILEKDLNIDNLASQLEASL